MSTDMKELFAKLNKGYEDAENTSKTESRLIDEEIADKEKKSRPMFKKIEQKNAVMCEEVKKRT